MIFEKQQYQQDCVNNIINALEDVDFKTKNFSAIPNNLKTLAAKNHYAKFTINNHKQLDVLMETGTGKTFTYLKTIFELNKRFNQRKFIIVLPRTAIKLGVIAQIKLTREYFYNEYKKHLNYIDYPKDGLKTIQQDFINSNDLSIIITNNQAFNSNKNNINKNNAEGLFHYGSVWSGISAQNPIVIIDEPHLLKAEKTTEYLEQLDSLFIRFGATYPDAKKDEKHQLANVVYTLDSVSAFNQYLVKKIAVSTVFANSEQSSLAVHNVKARLNFDAHYNINEQLYKTKIFLKDDIGTKTGLNAYKGITVVKINAGKVFFSDGNILESSNNNYTLSELEVRQMVKQTIMLHFEKEQALFAQNIKTLSLFFISQVNHFRGDNPLIKTIFEQEYKLIRDKVYQQTNNQDYKKYLDHDYQNGKLQVHEGYFSGDKGKNKTEKEDNGVDIILNEKEKLLSFDTPLRFVFSVWALQEGWDNPNIFTICKLSNTDKETSRRQQVGRGLRVAVNQSGRRLTHQHLAQDEHQFYEINTLDMVVSGQEQDFIYAIQNEILEASFSIAGDTITLEILKGKELTDSEASRIFNTLEDYKIIDNQGQIQSPILDFLTAHRQDFKIIDDERFEQIKQLFSNNHRPTAQDKNKKKSKMVKVRQGHWQHFKTLWEAINKKSTIVYQPLNEQTLIKNISQQFNQKPISPTTIKINKEVYNTQDNRIEFISQIQEAGQGYFNQTDLSRFITKLSDDEKIPLRFMLALFGRLDIVQFTNNPHKAKSLLTTLIKDNIHQSMLNCVGYNFNQTNIYANSLQDKDGKLIKEIKSTQLGQRVSDEKPNDNFLYDTVIFDSNIEKNSILQDPSIINNQTITVFAKLPKINIPTPYKTYNPDFAYLLEQGDGKQLFLVVETKGYKYESDIADDEKYKIDYAKRFFKALQKELPDIDIQYKTRINGQGLGELLREVK